MELYLNRKEIRRQGRAILGQATDDTLSAQVNDKQNALIDAAALKVQADTHGGALERRTTINVGAQQNAVNYPANCGAGGIIELAWYDSVAKQYVPIEPRPIPAFADQDQLAIVGGDDFAGVCGPPRYWQQREQLYLWPFTDQAYAVRARHIIPVTFANDIALSVVDAQLVIFNWVAAAWEAEDEPQLAQAYRAQYQDRLMALRAWISTGNKVAIASDASFDEDEEIMSVFPNWDTRPTIR